MHKKKFNKNNPPVIEDYTASSTPLDPKEAREMRLEFSIDGLKAAENCEEQEAHLAQILEVANELSQESDAGWERAAEIIKRNIDKAEAPIHDSLLMDVVDIAMHDPQIERFREHVNEHGLRDKFKDIAGAQGSEAHIPRDSIALLSCVVRMADEKSNVQKEAECLLNAIDPNYHFPKGSDAPALLH